MALFCAIPMAFFSLVGPIASISTPNKALCILWLLVFSPVGLATIGWLINSNGKLLVKLLSLGADISFLFW